MRSLLSAIAWLLAAGSALAQEGAAGSAPPQTVSTVYVVLFVVVFFGMIVGFFVYLWWSDRKNKPKE